MFSKRPKQANGETGGAGADGTTEGKEFFWAPGRATGMQSQQRPPKRRRRRGSDGAPAEGAPAEGALVEGRDWAELPLHLVAPRLSRNAALVRSNRRWAGQVRRQRRAQTQRLAALQAKQNQLPSVLLAQDQLDLGPELLEWLGEDTSRLHAALAWALRTPGAGDLERHVWGRLPHTQPPDPAATIRELAATDINLWGLDEIRALIEAVHPLDRAVLDGTVAGTEAARLLMLFVSGDTPIELVRLLNDRLGNPERFRLLLHTVRHPAAVQMVLYDNPHRGLNAGQHYQAALVAAARAGSPQSVALLLADPTVDPGEHGARVLDQVLGGHVWGVPEVGFVWFCGGERSLECLALLVGDERTEAPAHEHVLDVLQVLHRDRRVELVRVLLKLPVTVSVVLMLATCEAALRHGVDSSYVILLVFELEQDRGREMTQFRTDVWEYAVGYGADLELLQWMLDTAVQWQPPPFRPEQLEEAIDHRDQGMAELMVGRLSGPVTAHTLYSAISSNEPELVQLALDAGAASETVFFFELPSLAATAADCAVAGVLRAHYLIHERDRLPTADDLRRAVRDKRPVAVVHQLLAHGAAREMDAEELRELARGAMKFSARALKKQAQQRG